MFAMVMDRLIDKVYMKVVRPAMLIDFDMDVLNKRQEAELEVVELRMLRFSVAVMRTDRIKKEHIRGTAQV